MTNGLNQKYNHEILHVPFWYLYALLIDFPALVAYQTVRNTSERNRYNRQLKMLSALTFVSFHWYYPSDQFRGLGCSTQAVRDASEYKRYCVAYWLRRRGNNKKARRKKKEDVIKLGDSQLSMCRCGNSWSNRAAGSLQMYSIKFHFISDMYWHHGKGHLQFCGTLAYIVTPWGKNWIKKI